MNINQTQDLPFLYLAFITSLYPTIYTTKYSWIGGNKSLKLTEIQKVWSWMRWLGRRKIVTLFHITTRSIMNATYGRKAKISLSWVWSWMRWLRRSEIVTFFHITIQSIERCIGEMLKYLFLGQPAILFVVLLYDLNLCASVAYLLSQYCRNNYEYERDIVWTDVLQSSTQGSTIAASILGHDEETI